jgi:hypothetical protein
MRSSCKDKRAGPDLYTFASLQQLSPISVSPRLRDVHCVAGGARVVILKTAKRRLGDLYIVVSGNWRLQSLKQRRYVN